VAAGDAERAVGVAGDAAVGEGGRVAGAVAPGDGGRVVGRGAGGIGVGEGGQGEGARGGALHRGGRRGQAGDPHRGVGDGGCAGDGLGRGALVVDRDGDLVAALLRVGVAALDREGGAADRD